MARDLRHVLSPMFLECLKKGRPPCLVLGNPKNHAAKLARHGFWILEQPATAFGHFLVHQRYLSFY